jgi:hypothetical protein
VFITIDFKASLGALPKRRLGVGASSEAGHWWHPKFSEYGIALAGEASLDTLEQERKRRAEGGGDGNNV